MKKDREYFFKAYLADYGGEYQLEVGLLGYKTNLSNADVDDVFNEIQNLSIYSDYKPEIQVSIFGYAECWHLRLLGSYTFSRYCMIHLQLFFYIFFSHIL